MDQRELAAWLRKEHEQVQRLADRLRERAAIVPRALSSAWIAETRDRFEHFRAHLQKHMALEEKEGYMQAVLDRRPTLSPRVERLEQEHRDMTVLLDDLHRLAGELDVTAHLLVRDFCERVMLLLGHVEHHENEENDLVQLVFTQDIGTND